MVTWVVHVNLTQLDTPLKRDPHVKTCPIPSDWPGAKSMASGSGASPGKVVLGCIRKQAEQATGKKQ